MVAGWAIADNVARVTYRFRPKPAIVEAIDAEERLASGLTLEDYRWEIVGGGDVDPTTVEWNQQFGQKIRFDELQLFLVMFLHPLRDVEQSLNQIRTSPLGRLLAGSDIPQAEQAQLVQILSNANDSISASPTISQIGGRIDQSFAETAGAAFRMKVELGMSAPSFNDIARSLTILLSNKAMTRFDPSVNGLGLNNVLYVCLLLRVFEERIAANKTPGQLLLFEEPEAHLDSQLQRVLFKSSGRVAQNLSLLRC